MANECSSLNFICFLSEIEWHIQSLHAFSILNANDRSEGSCHSREYLSRDAFLVTEILTEYQSLGLIPARRVKYLDDIFEQCKQALGEKYSLRAVRSGERRAQEVLSSRAKTLLTAHVEGADTSLLNDFVKWYVSAY